MIFSLAFIILLLLAALIDLRELRIPNAIPLVIALSFVLKAAWVATFDGMALPVLTFGLLHLIAGLLIFLLGLAAFACGLIGGGDAKLTAAAALWLGFEPLSAFLTVMALAGGLLGLMLLPVRGLVTRLCARRVPLPSLEAGAPLPFGVAIALAGIVAELGYAG